MQRTERVAAQPTNLAAPRRRVLLAVIPLAAVLTFSVLPAARAGQLPAPIRDASRVTALRAGGPAASAYPYREGPGPALDGSGFVAGECTSFAAWWLTSRGLPIGVLTRGPSGTAWFLNASSWDTAARAAGYHVGTQPAVGAVAQWHAKENSARRDPDGSWHTTTAGVSGHVAIVVRVLEDGQAEWLEYGYGGRPQLHRGSGFAPRYLYLGVTPPPGAGPPGTGS